MAYLSIYRAAVVDRKDPEKMGRVKLKVPQIWGDDTHDYWALPKGMFSGNAMGFLAMPEVGDIVWVQFEGGDPRYPVWEHGPWLKDKGVTLGYDDSGEPTRITLSTQSGQLIQIDDKEKTILLKQSDGGAIKITKDGISLIKNADKGISLGSDNTSAEPAVLGDKNADRLDEIAGGLKDLAQALTADVAASTMSGPFLMFTNLATAAPQVLANMVVTKTQIPQTKSKKVTLD